MKDTLELLRKHEGFFSGSIYMEHSWARPWKKTIVIGYPRSGSTLLMRLMNMACLSQMIGDRPAEFYEGMLKVYQAINYEGLQYGHLILAEDKNEFWDCWQGVSKKRQDFVFKNLIALMFGLENRSSYCKTTMLGFGNELVIPVVQMLRDLYEDDLEYDLRVVWLRRKADDVMKSIVQKNEEKGLDVDPAMCRRLLEIQEEQFFKAYRLGDKEISYDQLIEDPIGTLRKCNPLHEPNKAAVENIMKKVIR